MTRNEKKTAIENMAERFMSISDLEGKSMAIMVMSAYAEGNSSQESMCVARYTLAVDRRGARDGQQSADFISCVAFGKNGEFAEKYFKQGTKIAITGRIQTGSYTNRDGQKIYTTDVVIEEQEFAESKKAAGEQEQNAGYTDAGDGFMNIPDGVDEQLPFA